MATKLSYEVFKKAVMGTGAAFRSITTLQPVGGEGDRVFPATYSDRIYTTEKRRFCAILGDPQVRPSAMRPPSSGADTQVCGLGDFQAYRRMR